MDLLKYPELTTPIPVRCTKMCGVRRINLYGWRPNWAEVQQSDLGFKSDAILSRGISFTRISDFRHDNLCYFFLHGRRQR